MTTERGLIFLNKYTELSQLMKGVKEDRLTKLVSQIKKQKCVLLASKRTKENEMEQKQVKKQQRISS